MLGTQKLQLRIFYAALARSIVLRSCLRLTGAYCASELCQACGSSSVLFSTSSIHFVPGLAAFRIRLSQLTIAISTHDHTLGLELDCLFLSIVCWPVKQQWTKSPISTPQIDGFNLRSWLMCFICAFHDHLWCFVLSHNLSVFYRVRLCFSVARSHVLLLLASFVCL